MKNKILLLNNIDENNYKDKVINAFSYEERLKVFKNFVELNDKSKVDRLKFLLTPEEISLTLKNEYINENVNTMIIPEKRKLLMALFRCLDMDWKVAEFLKLDRSLMAYTCNTIFYSDELKSGFIDRIDKNANQVSYLRRVIINILENTESLETKIINIDKLVDVLKGVDTFIPILNNEEIDHFFNDFGLSEKTKVNLILKCKDSKKAKECFLKLNGDVYKSLSFLRFSKEFINETNEFELVPLSTSNVLDTNFSINDIKEMLSSIENIDLKIKAMKKFSDAEKLQFLQLLSEEEKIYLLTTFDDSRIMFAGLNYLEESSSISEVLFHFNGKLPKYNEHYNGIIKKYAEIYDVDFNHLLSMSKAFSLEVINSLDIDNIRSIINMEDVYFNRFISFFNKNNTKLNSYSLNNIFEAFANKTFNVNYGYIKHYFTDVMKYCKSDDGEAAKEIIAKVLKITSLNKLNEKYTVDSMFALLAKGDKNAENDFHNLCNEFIETTRKSEIESSIDIYTTEYLDKVYETNGAINAIITYFDLDWIYRKYLSKMDHFFSPKERELLGNKELLKQIYDFKRNPTQSPPQIIKTNMFTFNKIMDKFYSEYMYDDNIANALDLANLKTVPLIPDIDIPFLIGIISNLNADDLKEKILSNESLCNGLNNLLKKYSYLSFNKEFSDIQLEADSYCDTETVASIFLNYESIMKDLKKTNTSPSMTSILDAADSYNPKFEIYKSIFGTDAFNLITLNPPENRAPSLRKDRREGSLLNYVNCYKHNKSPVPPSDKDIIINGKPLNVVIGNFTNPINLVYGELTGSCMRCGGLGEELYDFCLKDDRGIHVRFTNPKTGEFVSRVSGFRNGNTVFLNQLRMSASHDYDSNDLLEAITLTAKSWIEETKNSEHPIENVVISPDKAMGIYENDTIDLGISSIFRGIARSFWFDLRTDNAILLASSNPDNSLVPISLGDSNIDYYDVQRDKISFSQDPNYGVRHIEALEQILSGKKIQDITFEDTEYETCYYGEDWYVAVDKEGNIHKKIMNKSKNHEKAFEEMNITLENIQEVEGIFKKN